MVIFPTIIKQTTMSSHARQSERGKVTLPRLPLNDDRNQQPSEPSQEYTDDYVDEIIAERAV